MLLFLRNQNKTRHCRQVTTWLLFSRTEAMNTNLPQYICTLTLATGHHGGLVWPLYNSKIPLNMPLTRVTKMKMNVNRTVPKSPSIAICIFGNIPISLSGSWETHVDRNRDWGSATMITFNNYPSIAQIFITTQLVAGRKLLVFM